MKNRKSQTGVTLIELMIVVVIIGIIAAFAFPAYQSYMQDTRRSAAMADLMDLAQWMERQYAGDFSYLEGGAQPTLPFTRSPRSGGSTPFYTLGFSGAVTQSAFTVQAVPSGAQSGDRCGTLTLNQAGVRGAARTDCW